MLEYCLRLIFLYFSLVTVPTVCVADCLHFRKKKGTEDSYKLAREPSREADQSKEPDISDGNKKQVVENLQSAMDKSIAETKDLPGLIRQGQEIGYERQAAELVKSTTGTAKEVPEHRVPNPQLFLANSPPKCHSPIGDRKANLKDQQSNMGSKAKSADDGITKSEEDRERLDNILLTDEEELGDVKLVSPIKDSSEKVRKVRVEAQKRVRAKEFDLLDRRRAVSPDEPSSHDDTLKDIISLQSERTRLANSVRNKMKKMSKEKVASASPNKSRNTKFVTANKSRNVDVSVP